MCLSGSSAQYLLRSAMRPSGHWTMVQLARLCWGLGGGPRPEPPGNPPRLAAFGASAGATPGGYAQRRTLLDVS
jgi:hypothetical protein